MCGRIETCLLIGVELVREGCGLSHNRTQKRRGGELSVSLFYTIRSRCHEQWDGMQRKFSNLPLSKCVRGDPNDEMVYMEKNVKTLGILVVACYTTEQKKKSSLYFTLCLPLQKFGVEVGRDVRPNAQTMSLPIEKTGISGLCWLTISMKCI